jgi:hypothetical protein
MKAFWISAITLMGAWTACGQELPAKVRAAVSAAYPNAKVASADKVEDVGRVVYMVTLLEGKAKIELEVAANGKIESKEFAVDPRKLPAGVMASVKAAKPTRINRALFRQDGDDKVFLVEIWNGKETHYLEIAPSGKIVQDVHID